MQVYCHGWIWMCLCFQVRVSSVQSVQRHTVFVQHVSPCLGFLCGIHLRVLAQLSRFSLCLICSELLSIPSSNLQFDPKPKWCYTETSSFVQDLTHYSAVGLSGSAPRQVLGFSWRPGVTGDLPVPPNHNNPCDTGPLTTIQVPNWPH